MGIFDYINCHYAVPDGDISEYVFRTKDTIEQYLRVYLICADGYLWYEQPNSYEYVREKHTGGIHFYYDNIIATDGMIFCTKGDAELLTLKYWSYFEDGLLVEIGGFANSYDCAHLQSNHVTYNEFFGINSNYNYV